MFELRQIEQLVVISESRALSAATEKLFISQPALSRSMHNLEKNPVAPMRYFRENNSCACGGRIAASTSYATVRIPPEGFVL